MSTPTLTAATPAWSDPGIELSGSVPREERAEAGSLLTALLCRTRGTRVRCCCLPRVGFSVRQGNAKKPPRKSEGEESAFICRKII